MQGRTSITSLITIVVPVRSLKYVLFLWMLIAIPLVVSGQTEEPKIIQKKPAFTVETYGSGTPIYMIPGLASGGEVWQGTIERLKDHYECHVFTLAGFAGKEPISRTPYLKTMRKNLMDYIDAHGSGIVVGHSLGGFLSLWIAIANDGLVKKSIIVDSYPFLAALRQPEATEETVQFPRKMMIQQMTQMDSAQFRRQQKNTLSTMISDGQNIQKALKWSMASDRATIVNAMGDLMQTDLRDEINKIQTPTYIMVAGNISMNGQRLYSKKQVKQQATEQYKNLSDKTISVAENARHFIMMDDPQWFYQTLIRYLDE